MKKILSCTDGSLYAPSVYAYTAWAARRTHAHAPVHVIHLLDAHRERAEIADLSGHIGMDTEKALLSQLTTLEESKNRQAREKGQVIIDEARRHLTEAGLTDFVAEQLHGELIATVTAMEAEAGLVVIGQCGESQAPLHPGSNLEQIVRDSVRPVLVVPQHFSPVTRFLIAYDGSASAEKALDFLLNQPLLKGLTCHILRTGKTDDRAAIQLQEAAGKLEAAGYAVTSHLIAGHPETVVGDVVRGADIQMLVMGAYGHSRLRQWIIGSTTTSLIKSSAVPILLFR